jgi:hypothetical protein
MQNVRPTHFSLVADRPSAVSDVLDRVTGIAPVPLLPGEQEAEYATHVAHRRGGPAKGCDRRPSDARCHRLILGRFFGFAD